MDKSNEEALGRLGHAKRRGLGFYSFFIIIPALLFYHPIYNHLPRSKRRPSAPLQRASLRGLNFFDFFFDASFFLKIKDLVEFCVAHLKIMMLSLFIKAISCKIVIIRVSTAL